MYSGNVSHYSFRKLNILCTFQNAENRDIQTNFAFFPMGVNCGFLLLKDINCNGNNFRKIFSPTRMNQLNKLEHYITRNVVIRTGRLIL
jgi:hypothetical protein